MKTKHQLLESFIKKTVISELRRSTRNRLVESVVDDSTINTITDQYLTAGLELETDDDGNDLIKNYDLSDIPQSEINKARQDVQRFVRMAGKGNLLDTFIKAFENDNYGGWESRFGYDFWLTRNGHGTGFWDRDELDDENVGERLATMTELFGPCNLYITDNGDIGYYSKG